MSYSKSAYYFSKKASVITQIRYLDEFEKVGGIPSYQLRLLAQLPPYHCFSLPKRNGKSRVIESPKAPLSAFLKTINQLLQPLYSLKKSAAAYGFVLQFPKDPHPRTILTNAQQHAENNFLLNIDLKDFFHQISFSQVHSFFKSSLFKFEEETAYQLALLCTYQGRLPMGSSTSPVLSNFATLGLDTALLKWASQNKCTYTRFVDDLSFSANHALGEKEWKSISAILAEYRFVPNLEKIKFYGSQEEKIVTGLVLNKGTISIPTEFVEELEEDIERLNSVLELQAALPNTNQNSWLAPLEQSIAGKVNFVKTIYGESHPIYLTVLKQFNEAYNTQDYLKSESWLDWGYEKII